MACMKGEARGAGVGFAIAGCVSMLAFLSAILIPTVGTTEMLGLPLWADGLVGMAMVTILYMASPRK
jgi:hypothetical protein